MFSSPIKEPSLNFTNVKIITIPTISFINDFGSLRAIKAVLVRKEIFNKHRVAQGNTGEHSVTQSNTR